MLGVSCLLLRVPVFGKIIPSPNLTLLPSSTIEQFAKSCHALIHSRSFTTKGYPFRLLMYASKVHHFDGLVPPGSPKAARALSKAGELYIFLEHWTSWDIDAMDIS